MKPNTVVIGFHELNPSEPVLQETHLLKDLRYSKIGRTEVVEYFTASDFVPRVIFLNKKFIFYNVEIFHYYKFLNHLIYNFCVSKKFKKKSQKFNKNQKKF